MDLRGPLRVGVGGPVGSGKTALVERLCKTMRGDYDIAVREQLRTELARLSDVHSVVFDLSDVTFIDAGTIGELIRIHKIRSRAQLEPEMIVVQNPHFLKIFDILGLRAMFRITDKLTEAVLDSTMCGNPYQPMMMSTPECSVLRASGGILSTRGSMDGTVAWALEPRAHGQGV